MTGPRIRSLLFVLLSLVFAVGGLPAFQLVPMSAVIDPAASPPATVFSLTNSEAEPIAVQLRVATRSILPDGTEITGDASDLLQVFPSQLVIRPGTTQTVRVRWIGTSIPEEELPFRLIAEQLPINLNRNEDDSSGVRFMLRYRATVYVRPPDTTSHIEVLQLTETDDGEHLVIRVRNNGTRHQSLPEGRIVIRRNNDERTIPMSDIEPFITVNVLPGATRVIRVPVGLLPFVPEQVDFQFDR